MFRFTALIAISRATVDGAGKTVLLHEECVRFYQGHFWRKPDEELTIPDFLRRELLTDTGEA
jgi:hypothetical protein